MSTHRVLRVYKGCWMLSVHHLIKSNMEDNTSFALFLRLGGKLYLKVESHTREERRPLPTIYMLYREEISPGCFISSSVIDFPLPRLKVLQEEIEQIDQAYPSPAINWRKHVGGGVYISAGSDADGVRIFEWQLCENGKGIERTSNGFDLSREQMGRLISTLRYLETRIIPELEDTLTCIERDDHMNQLGALRCAECNPFDWFSWT